jgi:hypothetical protein
MLKVMPEAGKGVFEVVYGVSDNKRGAARKEVNRSSARC